MSHRTSSWTRRALLTSGAFGLAGLWLWRRGAFPATLTSSPTDRLLARITFGATRETRERARELGPERTLEEQLHPEDLDDTKLEHRLAIFETLPMSGPELKRLPPERIGRELVAARLLRAIESRRQLFERVVEFWSDHFNVNHVKGEVSRFKTLDDRDVIRRHAFSRFEDLLRASAHSPAMLYYLDNHLNSAAGPNENYARELMELHTLGVDGGYSQRDVEEAARVLTGWSVDESAERFGEFRFDPDRHDPGEKSVLGERFPSREGSEEGERLVSLLATHPATARFLATKLVRHFVSEDAPVEVVQRVAGRFLETSGDLRATYRELFSPRSLAVATPLVTRPVHLFALLARRLHARFDPMESFDDFERPLEEMGQVPFQWKTPDGYPIEATDWTSAMLPRWKLAFDIAEGRLPTLTIDAHRFDDLETWLTSDERARLVGALGPRHGADPARWALAMCAPSWQWC